MTQQAADWSTFSGRIGRGETSAPPARSLLDVYAVTMAGHPGAIAVDAGSTQFSYRELGQAAAELSERLREIGVGPGDRVGVQMSSGTAELYVAILGVLSAGAAYVPVDADDPAGRARAIWSISEACAVVEDDLAVTVLRPPSGGGRQLGLDDEAWVIFTSGSTGEPKGVAISHRSAAAFVDSEARLWDVGTDDRVLAGLSISFDASCEEIWLAWRHGATLVPAPRRLVRAGAELGPWLVRERITVISTVPTLAAMWDDDALAGVRLLILGGEACPAELGWRLSAGREVWNTYGPTEASVVSTAGRIYPGQPIRLGWPLDGWWTAIVDDQGDPVSVGETGELLIGGVGLGRYLDAALDAERFGPVAALGEARAYRTGDIVREHIDGLEFIGRRDDQVKVGGRRIELGEIEAQLCAVPGVRAAAAALRMTAGGEGVLVGYVTGDVNPKDVRASVAASLPHGISPFIVVLGALPTMTSGKVDRQALPWPAPPRDVDGAGHTSSTLTGTAAWLAKLWAQQLGPVPITLESDFFELGGTSVAVAKLVSVIRGSFPALAVADVYVHRQLGDLAAWLDGLATGRDAVAVNQRIGSSGWGAVQLVGVLFLLALGSPRWILAILTANRLVGTHFGPQVGWGWLIAGWLVFVSPPGRAGIVVLSRRLLLGRLRPGKYPRRSWLACRIWFVQRLSELFHVNDAAGTPWAPWYARAFGAKVAEGVRLHTLPSPTSMAWIGSGACVEGNVDLHGWWIDGAELVIDEIRIGAGARVGARSLLMPGADVGEGADIEAGSVVHGVVPAGERWHGSPARHDGVAASCWPTEAPASAPQGWLWKAMYGIGTAVLTVIPTLAAVPEIVFLRRLVPLSTLQSHVLDLIMWAPVLATSYLVTYALLVALLFRGASRFIRPGWHTDDGSTSWAVWFTRVLLERGLLVLFPIYSSVYTKSWLRMLGIRVGCRTEMSHAVTLNRLVTVGRTSFVTDDVGFIGSRYRGGWLQVAPITIGDRTFLGNGALLHGGTRLGDDGLVGVLSTAPMLGGNGTSWFGAPPVELPRVRDQLDPSRTTQPSRQLVLGRAATELVRIIVPSSFSVALIAILFWVLDTIDSAAGTASMLALAPFVLLSVGVAACCVTIGAKWLIIGRYRCSNYPLWSFFVWRDEIINSCQEQLSGVWLLNIALGTPLMPVYLRAMGAHVGRDVWFETLNVTEFDVVNLGKGCVVNRMAHVETHLFQDRLLRIGPTTFGPGATLGPSSAALPDTKLGAGCSVGGRSVVLRGEELPPGTRWHGAPLVTWSWFER